MPGTQTCPACGVKVDGGVVHFSVGAPGSRAKLYARVCQFAKKAGCINTDPSEIGEIKESDGYGNLTALLGPI